MLDKNGIEMKTGDAVKVSGAYFKIDNGLYFIDHTPGDPSWCGRSYGMKGINKNGTMSKTRSCAFWPLESFLSDRHKSAYADKYNKENAKIEIVHNIPVESMIKHFAEEKESAEDRRDFAAYNWGEDHDEVKKFQEIADHYQTIIERLTATEV